MTASPLTSLTLQFISMALEGSSLWPLPKQLQATHSLLPATPVETVLTPTAPTAPTATTAIPVVPAVTAERARRLCRSLIGHYLHMVWPLLQLLHSSPASCKLMWRTLIASRIIALLHTTPHVFFFTLFAFYNLISRGLWTIQSSIHHSQRPILVIYISLP